MRHVQAAVAGQRLQMTYTCCMLAGKLEDSHEG
jgi:hypothetical protein